MAGTKMGSGIVRGGVTRQIVPGVTALGPAPDMQHPDANPPHGCVLRWRQGIIVLRVQGAPVDTD